MFLETEIMGFEIGYIILLHLCFLVRYHFFVAQCMFGRNARNYYCCNPKPFHFFLGSIWSDFTPQIQGLDKDKFTVVVWDPPGYGHSRPPERDFSPGYFQRDADLAFKLMKVDLQYDLQ